MNTGNNNQPDKQLHQWRMPPEWKPHRRCWMAWPCNEALWVNGLDEPRRAYAMVARAIASLEEVTMIARPEDVAHASDLCGRDNIRFLPCPLDDSWLRDSGPTFVFDARGRPAGVNWTFNGWGEQHPCSQDVRLATSVLSYEGVEILPSSLIMEGGALHVDGQGTLMITEECMRHRYRDQEFDRDFIEGDLNRLLGIDKILWLPWGLADDDTAGHVDNVACFTAPGRVLALTAIDSEDADHERLQENLDYLRSETDASGQPLQVDAISQPRPQKHPSGHRLSQSYINFYLPNDGVVMPLFGDEEKDWQAQKMLRRHFPQRQLITVPGEAIAVGGGNVHCITQQQPDPVSGRDYIRPGAQAGGFITRLPPILAAAANDSCRLRTRRPLKCYGTAARPRERRKLHQSRSPGRELEHAAAANPCGCRKRFLPSSHQAAIEMLWNSSPTPRAAEITSVPESRPGT